MALLQVILLLGLLMICAVGPGLLFVHKVRWSGIEKLCAVVGLSLILIYLFAAIVYWTGVSWSWSWVFTGVSVVGLGLSWRELRRFFGRHVIRRQVRGFGMLLGLGLLLLGITAHYSGGGWAADWTEHYQRTHFFLKRLPLDTLFINVYPLPSRPPFMHLVGAFFQGQVGDGFDLFQVITLFLNVLVFFPCVMVARQMTQHGSRRVALIAGMLATCPMLLQNATWAWNKQFAAFFVILSIAFYMRGWRKPSSSRMVAAAASMAAGILVHYSAVPYALFLGLHYAWQNIRQRRGMMEVTWSGFAAGLLLLSWFGWSIVHYGVGPTLGSNTTITDSRGRTVGEQAQAIAQNITYTIIPHPLRQSLDEFNIEFIQPNAYGYIRDWFFNLYQTNLPFALGSLGWLIAIWLVMRLYRAGDRSVTRFWMQLIVFIIPVGIAVHGSVEPYGVAQVCLQPMLMLGRTLLAAGWTYLGYWMRGVLVISLVVDVVLGVVLQFRIQMLQIPAFLRDGVPVVPLSDGLLNPQAIVNSFSRAQFGFVYFADHFQGIEWVLAGGAVAMLAFFLIGLVRHRFVFAVTAMVLFACGAIICFTDRAAGYTVRQSLISPENPTAEHYQEAIQPLLPAIEAHSESSDDHFQLATVAYEYGRLDPALASLRNTLLLDPDHLKARHLVGVLVVVNRLRLHPNDVLTSIIRRTYDSDEAHYVRYGAMLGHAGFQRKARQVLADATDRFPTSASAHANYGMLLLNSGEVDAAIVELTQALRLNRGSEEIHQRLREALERHGDAPDAIEQRIRQIQAGG